jgi:osmotically-inducible protein OsmY
LQDLRNGQGNRVQVQVNNGIATLMGSVENRDAMQDAVESAYDGGARKVVNNLHVSRYDERPW